jgi:hypothetical protein
MLATITLLLLQAGAVPDAIAVPQEVEALVPAAHVPIALEKGDLNGDGLADLILVTEDSKGTAIGEGEDGYREHRRALLVLARTAEGSLRIAARSDRAVYCRECGGTMGDPFQGVSIEGTRFSISHYGGSGWRWSNEYTFGYSRRDRAWQLVRVEERGFHAMEPDDVSETVYRPPRDFGKIDFRDFDPENFLGQGPK